MNFPLTGLIPAAFTPLKEDGCLNLSVISHLAELYSANNLNSVFIGGTTGECHSLTIDERKQITAAWSKVESDRLTLIAHVGSNSLPEAQSLAEYAKDCGVHAVAAMAPFFFKPTTVDQLVNYCRQIADAAGDLPFYYYHIPSMTGVDLPMAEFLRCGGEQIPSLAGLKFTHTNLADLQECIAVDNGRFDVLSGHDDILLAGLSLGARGAIGCTYNFAAPVYHRIIEAYQQNDMTTAQDEQMKSVKLIQIMLRFGIASSGKAIMKMLGIDCGPVRAPLESLDEGRCTELYNCIKHLDVFCGEFVQQSAVVA